MTEQEETRDLSNDLRVAAFTAQVALGLEVAPRLPTLMEQVDAVLAVIPDGWTKRDGRWLVLPPPSSEGGSH